MTSERTVLNYFGKALWDPTPTKTDLRARQLAAGLGYPTSWRVVRTIETDNRTEESAGSPRPMVIVDRIYAGKPGTGCDMWYHHPAAMAVAEKWVDDPVDTEQGGTLSTPFDQKGGHLLARQAKYTKGDKVQVLYENKWWDATVLRRKEHTEGFRYQVHYASDNSRQSGVDERLIRQRPQAKNPKKEAELLGFGEEWQAYSIGNNRWKIVSPDGETYTSKKKALEAYSESLKDTSTPGVGDPPWRTTGSDYLGRRMVWTTQHQASARRTVTIDQIGNVTGWIAETDVDKDGEPGFVSDRTGKPAKLYHVVFEDDPNHPYANHLVQSQDVEEYELLEGILPAEEAVASPPNKKRRKR